jgi:nucleoside-diphosphate-sugar epimerase
MAVHLVTGAAGFLGSYLVRALVEQDRAVRAFDRVDPGNSLPGVEWRTGDVRDVAALRRACEGCEVVFHLASLNPQRKANLETMRAVNVGGTGNILEAARAAGVRRVVYLSSVEIFGAPKVAPCPEWWPPAPLGEYGRNKIAAEALCCQAVEKGLEVTMLRPMTIIGPGMAEPYLLSILASIRASQPVSLLGKGENRFQFVHAEDVAEACLIAAKHPAAVGEAFNIGSADVPPIRKMVEEIIQRVGSTSTIRSIPMPLARLAVAVLHPFGKAPVEPEHLAIAAIDYVFDISLAKQKLGWQPRWGNVDAIMDAYKSIAAMHR